MPPASRPVTRRTALALGAAGVATLSACSLLPDDVSATSTKVAADPDASLVDEATARISATAALTTQVPQLSAMHAAHLAALEAEPSDIPSVSPTPPPATASEIRRSERQLKAYLIDASMQAESGPLARLFASMSAAVSQQLVALPQEVS